MQILARTYHVACGVPPRRFAVTFELGGEHRVQVAGESATRVLKWHGRGYRPGSRQHLQAVVDRFLELEAHESARGGLERANAELLHPSKRPAPCQCDAHERQLPVGDRG